MRAFGIGIWCYRNTHKPWLAYGCYSSGRLHHVTMGPVTVVLNYRSRRRTAQQG